MRARDVWSGQTDLADAFSYFMVHSIYKHGFISRPDLWYSMWLYTLSSFARPNYVIVIFDSESVLLLCGLALFVLLNPFYFTLAVCSERMMQGKPAVYAAMFIIKCIAQHIHV